MADGRFHKSRFLVSETQFRTAEQSIGKALNRKAGGYDCVALYQKLHYMADALGQMKEHLENWEASNVIVDDRYAAQKSVYMAETTLTSLRKKFKARCVKVN